MEKITHQPIKIAVVGPESSGKSTLVAQLSKQLNAYHINEFARDYLEKNGPEYAIEDLDYFAEKQLELENIPAQEPLLFCDTNPLSIKVWSLYKYEKSSQRIDELIDLSNYDLHLLLQPDLPYEFDPLREDSPQKNREELFELFQNQLLNINANYSIIKGLGEERLNNALKVIQSQFSF